MVHFTPYLFCIFLFLMYFLIPWFLYGPGCWIPSRYCSLQCFGCWHVWLRLSYSHRSLWHSSGAWGDNLICDIAIIHNQFSWVMASITSIILAEMQGVLKLKHQAMANDIRPIDPTCDCMVYSFTILIASFWLQMLYSKLQRLSFYRSAKNIPEPIFIPLLQKMPWVLNFCHIIIYITWWRYQPMQKESFLLHSSLHSNTVKYFNFAA